MLAPVIVDLGPDVPKAAVEIVLDACNEAISRGECVPDSLDRHTAPRAVAIARLNAAHGRLVRIEVRLGSPSPASNPDDAAWLVREIEFAPSDPTRERWRSVGLAIATLVGEGEREREEAALSSPASTPPPDAPPPDAPPPDAPAPAPAEAAVLAPATVGDAAVPSEPYAAAPDAGRAVFLGIGVQSGPGFGTGPWRIGADARASWVAARGWQVIAAFGYALRASNQDFTASWLTAHGGLGYRVSLSDAVSAGAAVTGGVQRMAFNALVSGVSRSSSVWNPSAGLGLDATWIGAGSFVGWIALDARTLGRESRLHIGPEFATLTSLPVDMTFSAGAGWWLR